MLWTWHDTFCRNWIWKSIWIFWLSAGWHVLYTNADIHIQIFIFKISIPGVELLAFPPKPQPPLCDMFLRTHLDKQADKAKVAEWSTTMGDQLRGEPRAAITKWKLNWFVVLSGLIHCNGFDAREWVLPGALPHTHTHTHTHTHIQIHTHTPESPHFWLLHCLLHGEIEQVPRSLLDSEVHTNTHTHTHTHTRTHTHILTLTHTHTLTLCSSCSVS